MKPNIKLSLAGYKQKLKEYGNAIKGIPWELGQHVFSFIVLLVLLNVLLGELLFYQYVFIIKDQTPEPTLTSFKFQEKVYNSVLEAWQTNSQATFGSQLKQGTNNPFK